MSDKPPEWELHTSVRLSSRTGAFGQINFDMHEALDVPDFVTLADVMKDLQELQKMITAKYKSQEKAHE